MFDIENLYRQYKQDVFTYLLSLTHHPTLSEDLLSETFLSAIKSIHNFKGDSNVKTWLFSIARHKWLHHLKKSQQDFSFDELISIYLSNDTEERVIKQESIKRIYELLELEDEKTRKIILMRIDGYSYYEISLTFSISEGSARVIDFRAKNRIRAILQKEGLYYE